MVLLLLAYAVGGAIINVAVAWGCKLWVPVGGDLNVLFKPLPGTLGWEKPIPNGWPQPTFGGTLANWGLTSTRRSTTPGAEGSADEILSYQQGVVQTGWPVRSLQSEVLYQDKRIGNPIVEWNSSVLAPDFIGPKSVGRRQLPLRVLFPGFAINTIFYAAILWLLCAAPGFVRRRIRIRRGRCAACGYPIGTSAVCTECGNMVPVATRREFS